MYIETTNLLPQKATFRAAEPEFLTRRVDAYYRERVDNVWQGKHPMKGKIPGRDAIQLMSNDYLSLSNHPEILRSQADALVNHGNGMIMSGIFLLNGNNPQHAFEQRLAHFMQAEDGILCQSGWCANTGLIQAIADENTPVYLDMFAHMSLWEGVLAAGAKAVPFLHNDVQHLEKQIKNFGPGVVVVDSVYSTSGSVCPLMDLVRVGNQNGCVLVVDESHSLGTHGPNGEGMVAGMGLAAEVHFRTASLAKAFAGRAGFITCSTRFADYFKCESRPAIFSSTLLPHEVAGLDATLTIIEKDKWRRGKLHENANYLRTCLDDMGYNLNDSATQIISLEAGHERKTIELREALEDYGIFGAPFCAPATPKNRSLVRFSVNCDLTRNELDRIIMVCHLIKDKVGFESWPSTRRKRRPNRNAEMRVAA
ncbi:MAG: alpha-hydroxyketone-type quorum-sensing autoinducer synthase [Burkholderiales bacterium]